MMCEDTLTSAQGWKYMDLQTQALYEILLGDAFEWLRDAEPDSIHAVVTDPPVWTIGV